MAIIYKDILEKLKEAGYTTYKLKKEKLIPDGTVQRIRDGRPITTETINIICKLLKCEISDVIKYIPDEEE